MAAGDNPNADCPGAWCGAKARYRCTDCFHPTLHCGSCVVGFHQRLPFHHIERWDGQCFERCTLKSLGVRIQLGHRLGEKCSNPAPASGDDFVIITSQTIDEVGLDYCNCSLAQSKPVQLLRMRLYPATGTNPRSAAMFSVLRRFAHMSLESKCSAYEFYNSLVRETDNMGLVPLRERYQEFLRMTRQWMHLQLVKRAGRGHDPCEDRINATQAGECALLCPVFLYALYIALDANFRLRRRDVSSEEKDPGFMKGWAFFGEVTNTCVAHDAVDKPDRELLGTASSGIGTVDCARHNMKRPNGVGDLQRGERYLNMDYILFMSLARVMQVIRFYISYDIACQWFKNLFTRMMIFDSDLQFRRGEQYLVFLVPKFHLPAHIEVCNLVFSFNLTPFVGQDLTGEAPEQGWADANRLVNSTSISGPGARRDALDTPFQYWNWKKIVSLGETLLTRMQKYVPMMLETRAAWVDLEASFADTVIETRALATHVKHVGLHETVDQGRKHIEQETKLRRKIEAWMVIQQLFIPEVTLLRESDDAARKRVSATQPLPGIRAQDVKLWMPSAVGRCVQCDQVLQEYEFQLREGQCEVSLDELRNNLLLRTHEYQYRDGVHGVKAKLRSGTRTNALTAQITKASEEYRAARAALRKGWEKHYKVLAEADVRGRPSAVFGDDERRRHGRRKKKRRLDPAEEAMEADRTQRRAEDGKAMSWIWVMEGMTGEDGDVVHNEALRIEWAKTRAKAMRYAEEVNLLEEEMRRVLQFLGWRAEWWRSLVGLRAESQSPALREGHAAYAHRQAAYMEGLQSRFRSQWRDIDKLLTSARKTYATMLPDEDEEETDKDTDTDEGEQGAGSAAAWLSD
ncbi:hypothetical protein B0H14DRAFT_3089114 [Mycena olivaceomarginata]|nr:hypothetical protein B0H14DRAFT_3089114 [Mycena olivaceomarginata]